MINLLIYGNDGLLDYQIRLILHKLSIKFTKGKVKADDIYGLEKEIKYINPTHIISFIERNLNNTIIDNTNQLDKLKNNIQDNLYSPIVFAILSNKYEFHYTYLGIKYMFDNVKLDNVKSDNVIIKEYTNQLMNLYPNVLNIILQNPINIDINLQKFITDIITYKKKWPTSISISVLIELLPIMIDMAINKKITGTINLINPGSISYNEILVMYKEIIDPDFILDNTNEQNQILTTDISNNNLYTSKLEELYPNILNIKESVRKYLELIKDKQIYKNYLDLEEDVITYELIDNNNYMIIQEIKKNFININTITIIAKGESAKYIDDAIGINQGIIFTNKKYLFMNDFVSFFGIEEYIQDIKYIFIPDYPHNGEDAYSNLTYKNVIRYLKKYNFQGKLFIYQIQTSLSELKFNNYTFNSCSSTDISIKFFNKFIQINNFKLYGVGKGSLYHKDLLNLNFSLIISDLEYLDLFNKYMISYLRCFNNSLSIYHNNTQSFFNNYYEEVEKTLNIKIHFN
jgi:3,5-epimerase/4-reductase